MKPSVYDLLRTDHPEVAAVITASEARGNASYPKPFSVDKKADWTPDLREELGDGMVYARAKSIQLEALARRDSRARHALLTFRALERRLAHWIVEIDALGEPWAEDTKERR